MATALVETSVVFSAFKRQGNAKQPPRSEAVAKRRTPTYTRRPSENKTFVFFAPLGVEGFRSLPDKTEEMLGSTVLVEMALLARLFRAFCFQFSFTQAVLLHARARRRDHQMTRLLPLTGVGCSRTPHRKNTEANRRTEHRKGKQRVI